MRASAVQSACFSSQRIKNSSLLRAPALKCDAVGTPLASLLEVHL